jgi:hypothetical protein
MHILGRGLRMSRLRVWFKSRSGGRLLAIFCASVLTALSPRRACARNSLGYDLPDRFLKQALTLCLLSVTKVVAGPLCLGAA